MDTGEIQLLFPVFVSQIPQYAFKSSWCNIWCKLSSQMFTLLTICPTAAHGFNNQNTKDDMSQQLPSGLPSKSSPPSSPHLYVTANQTKNSTLKRCRAWLSSHRLAQTKRTALCPSLLRQRVMASQSKIALSPCFQQCHYILLGQNMPLGSRKEAFHVSQLTTAIGAGVKDTAKITVLVK